MRVAIVGAGIGGLATALALAGRGHEITVYERRTGFGELGAGIQLSPNATHVLAGFGLGPALARMATEPERVRIRSLRSGREIGEVALGAAARERFGAPFLAVARAHLHTALLDAVRGRPEIRLRVGRSLVRIDEREAEADLAFETESGGRESATADLAVGADGLWSRARSAIGDERQPRHAGFAAYRASVPTAELPDSFRAAEVGLWLGPARHLVHYPVAGGRSLNVVALAPRADPLEGWSREETPDHVLQLFAGRGPTEVLKAARAWSAWSLYELPTRRIAGARVALVGDAAHPVLPYLAQGGSLAVEDAAHLAALLAGSRPDVPAALLRYGRERLDRVRRIQAAAQRNGRAYHAGWPTSLARDLVMRRLGPAGMLARYGWVYGWRLPPA
ncbi:FAD-dependent oxidoreductase [Enterovirga sp.]|uniref:FAD-dependent oxidoreductase n=1 Tax=Enterovirga sp. TaxID=2026350 RepID=UPI00262C8329|nr:FAD-dependent oxidoreductase [Enterovirga sp.]MDB5592786.1 FAD-binding monooxygenase [Enterovirga sp.]